jgi:D-sedoheptulose 7-phosphate isomerase
VNSIPNRPRSRESNYRALWADEVPPEGGGQEGAGWDRLQSVLSTARRMGGRVVTTNGCFDLLHPGHLHVLASARAMGDLLIVALNSDRSVRELKGIRRPVLDQNARARMLLALRHVDVVVIFDEATPMALLDELRPAVHCKGGDYQAEGLVEREVVLRHGGRICIVPMIEGYSTSSLLRASKTSPDRGSGPDAGQQHLIEVTQLLERMVGTMSGPVGQAARLVSDSLARGGTIFSCGNGGSAADAQHFTAELVGRFRMIRPGLRAVALTADSTVLTCLGNDFGFEAVFSRQIEALGRPGDIVLAISTSGKSRNLLAAVEAAHRAGVQTLALVGQDGAALGQMAQHSLRVPSNDTAVVQQGHRAILHALCAEIEQRMCAGWAALEEQPKALPAV